MVECIWNKKLWLLNWWSTGTYGEYEEVYLLQYNIIQSSESQDAIWSNTISSVFWAKEYAKQETTMKQAVCSTCCLIYAGLLLGLHVCPEHEGDVFLWKILADFHKLYGITAHKTQHFVVTTVRTSNPTWGAYFSALVLINHIAINVKNSCLKVIVYRN